jgi:hypothetical protein
MDTYLAFMALLRKIGHEVRMHWMGTELLGMVWQESYTEEDALARIDTRLGMFAKLHERI